MVLDEEMLSIKSFFNSRDIPLSDIWLESCINWYREENPSENCTRAQLKNVVWEQWLLLDLRQVEVPCLPPRLQDHKKLIFNGNYCVQVMCIVDISKPKHLQLSKIRNANLLTNILDVDKDSANTRRMLQLSLTDGVQEIDAIEYELVPSLNMNLAPGTKIRLIGPLTVRRGKIMLENRNVKVLGGEVEEILVSNATENILARALGFPENPNPISINVETDVIHPHVNNSISHSANKNNVNNTRSKNLDNIAQNVHTVNNINCESNVPSLDDINEEEEMRIAQEVEAIMDAVPGPSRVFESQRTPDMFEDENEINPIQRSAIKKPTETIDLLNSSTDSDIFKNFDIDSHLDQIDERNNKTQEISIRSLLQKQQNSVQGVFRVKAKFKGVIEKLTATNSAWSFKIEIEDESGTLIADMHTDVITELADCPPSVIVEYKNKINDSNNSGEFMIRNV